MSKPMKIGELSRKTGKTVRALHLYEERGLLVPQRSAGGFRLYGADELARVYWIGKLQDLGFKLSQISGLLSAVDRADKAPEAMEGVREIFDAKLAQTRDQLSRLKRLERDLEESLAYLEACRSCDEAASAQTVCTDCRSDRHVIPETSLVAGSHLRKENGTTTSGGRTGP